MKISVNLGNRIPDLLGFVNGIPLLFIELKALMSLLKMHGYNLEIAKVIQIYWFIMLFVCYLTFASKDRQYYSRMEHFGMEKISSEKENGAIILSRN